MLRALAAVCALFSLALVAGLALDRPDTLARAVAVFERAGRTCVLAGVVHRDSTLVKLAAWRADGALTF